MEERSVLSGRIRRKLAESALDLLISEDIELDKHLIGDDITGTQAHVVMLTASGIIDEKTASKILLSLAKLTGLMQKGKFQLDAELEDVHINVETFVSNDVGPEFGGKIHTARSRNDQVTVDTRIFLRRAINEISILVIDFIEVLLSMARRHKLTVMPGYTHLQHAQPITLAHWATAYAEMFLRDLDRLTHTYKRINVNPLGAVALAGTSWPINRKLTTQLLGFDDIQLNSLDAVTSRGEDVADTLASFSILATHASRLSEDIILWSTFEFRMIEIDESYSMASSIMPQKKNPDVAELARAKSAFIHSQLMMVLSLLRSLPSGYSKDSQLSKSGMIHASQAMVQVLKALIGLVASMKVNADRMLQLVEANFSTSTDLADFIARKGDISFRHAHQIVGSIIRDCVEKKMPLSAVEPSDIMRLARAIAKTNLRITKHEILKHTDPAKSIRAKSSAGSPNPSEVARMIGIINSKLSVHKRIVKKRFEQLNAASIRLQKEVSRVIGS